MGIVFDLILCAVFLLVVIYHTRKGFVDSLLQALSVVVSAVFAVWFGPRVGDVLNKTVFSDMMTEKAAELIQPVLGKIGSIPLSEAAERAGEEASAFVEVLEQLGWSVNDLIREIGDVDISSSEVAYAVAEPIVSAISTAIGFALVFFTVLLALFILRKLLRIVVRIPVLKQVNQVLGAVLGIVCGLVYLLFFCMLLGAIAELGFLEEGAGSTLTRVLEGSAIYRAFSGLPVFELLSLLTVDSNPK